MDRFKKQSESILGKGKEGLMKIKTASTGGGGASGKEQGKFQFDIKIYFVENLAITSGMVYVSWKRGSKSTNNGKTRSMPIVDKRVVFDHNVQMITTLLKTPKKTFESKNISISIKEDKGKKGTTIGKTIVDLAEFTNAKDEQRKIISIKPKKGKTPLNFVMGVKTTEMQIGPDEEPMTETDLNSNDGSDDEEDVEDFTQDDDTTSDISSSTSHSHSNNNDHSNGHSSTSPQLVKTPSSSSISTPSSSLSPFTKLMEKKQDKEKDDKKETDYKKRIGELEKEVSDLKKKPATTTAAAAPTQEVGDLKKRIKELAGENVDLEDRVKELEEKLASGGSGSGSSSPSISSSSLKDQRLIADLQDQVKQKDEQIRKKDDAIKQKEYENSELSSKNRQLERDNTDLKSRPQQQPQQNGNNNNNGNQEEVESLRKEIHQLKLEAAAQLSPATGPLVGGGTLELKRKIQDLNREIKDKDETISKLKAGGGGGGSSTPTPVAQPSPSTIQMANMEKQVQELNKTVTSQKQEIEKLKDLNSSMSKKPSSSSSSPPSDELKKELIDVKDKLTAAKDETSQYRERAEHAEKQLSYKTEDMEELEDRLSRRIRDLEEAKDQLESKLNNQTASAASLSLMSGSSSKSSSSSDKNSKEAAKQLDKERQEREQVERNLEKERQELGREREKVKKLEREVKELKDRVRQLESQLESGGTHHGSGASSPMSTGSMSSSTVAKSDLQEREENRIIEQCIYTQSLTFRDGVGASAYSLYHQLLDQNAFSQENSRLFNKVISSLTQTVEKSMENSGDLCYWISNVSGLIHLIKDGPNNLDNDRDPLLDGILIDQQITSPSTNSRRSPSVSFYYQLESLCRETYSLLLHNIYKKLKSKISNIYQASCILDKKSNNRLSSTLNHTNDDLNKICKVLSKFMTMMKDKYVFDSIIQQFFSQTFYYISNSLLNEILEGGSSNNSCSPSSGFKIKLSLSKIEDWVASSEERDLLNYCRDFLGGIADAANLMVIDKSIFTDTESIQSAFTTLNVLQIKRLLEIWKPDQLSPDPIPSSVLSMSRSNWNRPVQNLQLTIDPTILLNVSPVLD
ncbi:hypothetical protein DFA_05000 [Cavenderia fasciculata]|uniref:C2 NT-type domain-containing protein n=1 Tax=Cavenderia fasciculata TaxID=261658 RepID=F4PMX7_CACFS|nr:uncharacterized protein DFA_05000 [Cavenderia fasciculata]EGG22870.1 hypothetical protein DFA_05000 [Cavenderia fasciculata]|eukprot:XP_004360721.1 hypothetical protein DFA_05000 [Cavenderia fasciculata]